MAHRSRLGVVLIDCRAEDFEAAADFWAGALGARLQPSDDERYVHLQPETPVALDLILQRVDAADNGMHLDIETDDVEAEVRRLEALGARRKRQVKRWWVLEDPSGHAFCVVPVQSKTWPKGATEWPD